VHQLQGGCSSEKFWRGKRIKVNIYICNLHINPLMRMRCHNLSGYPCRTTTAVLARWDKLAYGGERAIISAKLTFAFGRRLVSFRKGSFREGWHLVFSYMSISCVSSFLIDVCMYKLNGQVSWSAVYILFSLGCFYFVSEHLWLDPITIKRSSRRQEKSHRSTSEDTGSSGKGFAISTI